MQFMDTIKLSGRWRHPPMGRPCPPSLPMRDGTPDLTAPYGWTCVVRCYMPVAVNSDGVDRMVNLTLKE